MNIKIEQLTKMYGKTKAVDHMNLQIADGELIGLLGPSGCGKSTTLFMLAGLIEPTQGRIFFGDKEVTSIPPEDREIGLVFQNYALYPHMTVEENIMFPLINRKMNKKEAREKAFEMASLVKLEELMKRKPKELSGGQQQRVAIARALVKKPQVLLLDEPLSNLDAKLRIQTREEIRRIQQEVKITTIFVTHDQEEAMSISDRIAVMDQGTLQQFEEPQKMYLNPMNRFVSCFLGMPQINMMEVLIKNGEIWCQNYLLRSNCAQADGKYMAGIRPESFKIAEMGNCALVDHVRMTGRDLLIYFSINTTELRALVHSDIQVEKGGQFCFAVRENQILIFDEKEQLIGKF